MSHLSKVFTDVPIEIQDRSGFDLSHENLFTTTVGTLTPCLVEEVLPGDIFDIGVWFQTKTPPLATPFYGKVDAKVEVFACANSVVWQGWKQFIQQRQGYANTEGQGALISSYVLPQAIINIAGNLSVGTLADYLGLRIPSGTQTYACNALPFLIYHKIWEDYYRNSLITKPFFNEYYTVSGQSTAQMELRNLPYFGMNGQFSIASGTTGCNGHRINELYQRCWAKDAYTTATLKPTFASGVDGANVTVDTTNNTFSIRDLRAANALQKFLERSNMSTKYDDFVMSHFGVYPSDAIMEKPMFLGQVTVPVYVNSVMSTANNGATGRDNGNPYTNVVGGQAGSTVSVGDGNIVSNFKCNWHGFIMAIYSLVPHANYATGVRKYLNVSNASQFAFPEFAGIGDEEVYKSELYAGTSGTTGQPFGYNRRFYRYLYHDDEVHGLFMDNQSLSSFVLSRSFDSSVTLNTQFMEIPKTALDEVLSYSVVDIEDESGEDTTNPIRDIGFQAMVDMYWNIKVLRRLPESPLPHL